MSDTWGDEVAEIECGGSVTWKRRFSVKGRLLFVNTGEGLSEARTIAAVVRQRIENTLLNLDFGDVSDEHGEYVSRGVVSYALKGEMVQAGGPPDAYDYHIKVRFELQTTTGVNP